MADLEEGPPVDEFPEIESPPGLHIGGLHITQRLLIHIGVGFGLGALGSILISSCLYMSLVHTSFAVCQAFVLLLSAVAMFLKTFFVSSGTPLMSVVIRAGAGMTLVSGGCSILLRAHTGHFFGFLMLLFTSLGVSYTVTYVTVDLWNRFVVDRRELCARQVYTIAASAVVVGVWSAILFTVVDIQDHNRRFGWEQWVGAGVAGIAGAFLGFANYKAVDESMLLTFDPLPQE
jgi:hypothetical protein